MYIAIASFINNFFPYIAVNGCWINISHYAMSLAVHSMWHGITIANYASIIVSVIIGTEKH